MAKLSQRAAAIKAAAELAYGRRGLTQLAAAAGVSKQLLSFIVRGDKPVTGEVYRRVALAIDKEAKRLEGVSARLVKMSYQMLKELKE